MPNQSLKDLKQRQCICGCGNSFRSTRPTDLFASMACEEFHTCRTSGAILGTRRDPSTKAPGPDPRTWLTASELAQRLHKHPSTITNWADKAWIPCLKLPNLHRRFNIADVREALRVRFPKKYP